MLADIAHRRYSNDCRTQKIHSKGQILAVFVYKILQLLLALPRQLFVLKFQMRKLRRISACLKDSLPLSGVSLWVDLRRLQPGRLRSLSNEHPFYRLARGKLLSFWHACAQAENLFLSSHIEDLCSALWTICKTIEGWFGLKLPKHACLPSLATIHSLFRREW